MSGFRKLVSASITAAFVTIPSLSPGQTEQVEVIERGDIVQLRPDYPTRYTVVKGDTLWDIATRFLQSPWHWPKIWTINEQIANPHLIYPGDVIVLRFVEGRPELTVVERPGVPAPEALPEALPEAPLPEGELPLRETERAIVQEFEGVEGAPGGRVTKLSPKVISKPLVQPIPTISPEIILPFLTKPLVVDDSELKKAGYVTIGLDGRIALGDNSEFYARGLPDTDTEFFHLYRKGQVIRDPDTKKRLGFQAIYLGDAKMMVPGDPSKLVVTKVKQEILPRDNMLVSPARAPLPYYFPHAPDKKLSGRILTALQEVSEFGPFTIVSISLGREDGIEEGHVLRVLRHSGKHRDPVTHKKYQLPDEESGLMMVFRTFDEVSYGLVINATRPIHILDTVVTP